MPRSPNESDDSTKRSRRRSVDASDDERRERRHRRRDREDDGEGRSRRRDYKRHESDSEDEHRARHSRRHRGDDDRRKRRDRSRSRDDSRRERRHRSRSPRHKRRRRSESGSRSPPPRKARGPLPSQDESYRGDPSVQEHSGTASNPPPPKQKPNYKPTGLLAKEANTVAGTSKVLKYHEPPEARKPPPKEAWRMYVFKKKDLADTIHLHSRSVWLVGRDQSITDLHLEHPSISKQHAVVQFRYLTATNEYGDKMSRVKPYLIDLDSANGTKLNGEKVEASRYVELVDGDVVVFGDSEREYVMMLPPAEG
ncbi:hypothetical protein D0861_05503 [Hortaea werneckii]|uniref:FHA domain-containing protein n=1 Tax=Hortaea werneckii TaxID=91943 RepID=A0A3M7FEF2_HORWE|nr:hypothetical protein D0861_05503 [Hortaea werneckii]